MITIVAPSDIGRRVTYRDPAASTIEEGVIFSLGAIPGSVFVRYGERTIALTPLDRLSWSIKTETQTAVAQTLIHGRWATIDWCEPPLPHNHEA